MFFIDLCNYTLQNFHFKVGEFTVAEIIEGIRTRDNTVLQYIYKKYYPTVHHFILSNQGSTDDAKDIFQESVIVIYRKIKDEDRFMMNSSFKTFIYSISRHLWLKQLRTRRYEDQKINDQQRFIELKEEPFRIDQEDLRMSLYQKHFKDLPADCQKILKLSVSNITQKEIADALGFSSENYIKKRKHYCKEYLIRNIKADPLFRELQSDE